MVTYAVVGLLDEKTTQYFQTMWKDLKERQITDYGTSYPHRYPHLTFADYTDIDLTRAAALFDRVLQNQEQIELSFLVLGTFLNTKTLFLAPTFSQKLYDLHASIHDHLKEFDRDQDSFYLKGRWNPHCTIASRLNASEMSEAIHYCQLYLNPMKVRVVEIALIEITVNAAHIVVSDRLLYSKKLE
ncbi:2'-5' RNA ligase family protein [Beduini massiliensis]|uniref:2'-5' RNA ligase family protein n=1 Tax=Beduini massiliensis TaxID=1585974 RepID=UPI0006939C05|nr:2'-5' RNA ligase family protein [Beduini massiliensis]